MTAFPRRSIDRRQGFTLAELLLSMLVFAIAITTILALLARSVETVDEILLKDEAMRLSGAVEKFFEEKPFSEAYTIAQSLGTASEFRVFAYHYRADPDETAVRMSDGSLTPRPDRTGLVGEDFLIVPGVRANDSPAEITLLNEDYAAIEGRLFQVRLTISPNNPEPLAPTSDAYPAAALVFYAEFYAIPNPAITDLTDYSPSYSYNFAVRR